MSWVDVTTAVGTAGAAVVALSLGLRAEWRAIKTEREAKAENTRRQAIHVAAWMLVEQDDGEGPREVDVNDHSFDRHKARVYEVVQNASEEPIWDVIVNAPILTNEDQHGFELGFTETEDEIIFIGPREIHKSEIAVAIIPYNRFPLKVEFRDNSGREWSRDERGQLHQGRVSEPSFAFISRIVNERNVSQRKKAKE